MHTITASVCFFHVLNDPGILMAAVQLFWSLIWHCSTPWLFSDRHCRSERSAASEVLQSCPTSSVNHVNRHNAASLEMQLCANDASIYYHHWAEKSDSIWHIGLGLLTGFIVLSEVQSGTSSNRGHALHIIESSDVSHTITMTAADREKLIRGCFSKQNSSQRDRSASAN